MLKLKIGDSAKYIGHTKACRAEGCTSDFSHLEGKVGEIFEWVNDYMAAGVRIEGEKYWFMKEHLVLVASDLYSDLYKAGFEDGMKHAAELAKHNVFSCRQARDAGSTSCGEMISKIIQGNMNKE